MKNIKTLICISLCFTLLLLTGCGYKPKLSNGKELVAQLEENTITVDDLYEMVKNRHARNILIEMIDKIILDKNYEVDDEMHQTVENQIEYFKMQAGDNFLQAIKYYYGANDEVEFKEMLIMEQQRNKAINEYVKTLITDKEINNYYEKETVGDIKASHILIRPNVTDEMTEEEKGKEETKALNLAKEIITKLNNGEKFTDLAKKYSEDKANSDKGGDLGFFNKGKNDEAFEEAAYKLKKDKYTTEPVKSAYGYHIILKTDEKVKPELKLVKSTIINNLIEKKLADQPTLSIKALIELRKDNKLEIYDTELKKQYDDYIKELLKPVK